MWRWYRIVYLDSKTQAAINILPKSLDAVISRWEVTVLSSILPKLSSYSRRFFSTFDLGWGNSSLFEISVQLEGTPELTTHAQKAGGSYGHKDFAQVYLVHQL